MAEVQITSEGLERLTAISRNTNKKLRSLERKMLAAHAEQSQRLGALELQLSVISARMEAFTDQQEGITSTTDSPIQSKELKRSGGARRRTVQVEKLEDANNAGGKESPGCTLILTEGDSAKNLAMVGLSVLGRDNYGVFPLRGKLLNVKDASEAQIISNKVIVNIMKILGLKKRYKEYKNVKRLRYGRIMIMTDQDHDGSHIKGLIISLFHSFWPTLLKIDPSFIVEFITPVVKATHKAEGVKTFYSKHAYTDWNNKLQDGATDWVIRNYKGLGTSTSKEGIQYFSEADRHIKTFVWRCNEDGDAIELAFNKKKTKDRKKWLMNLPKNHLDRTGPQISYGDFINYDLIFFSKADLERSIPSLVDGLKLASRRILFCAFKKNKAATVEDLSAYVSEVSAHHHSEQSLAKTIIGMAQDYVGSNNVNLLKPDGQFGTRNYGGKDAANAKYISTELSPITRILFPKEDDVFLEHEKEITPQVYMPIIPLILVNGAKGIGTGWSTFIPNYNPRDIVANVRRLLKNEKMEDMIPWYRNFKGIIAKVASKEGPCTYTTTGQYEIVDATTLRITELPINKWTKKYCSFLDAMKKKGSILNVENNSDATSVNIKITMTEESMKVALSTGITKTFKLIKAMSTRNIHLFDHFNVLKKYNSPEEVLQEFFEVRIDFYKKKKDLLKSTLSLEVKKLVSKLDFIGKVLSGEIKINGEIIKILESKGFPRFAKISGSNSNFDYLVELDLLTMTTEDRVQELAAELVEKEKLCKYYNDATAKSLWSADLDRFIQELETFDSEDAKEKEAVENSRKKNVNVVMRTGESPPNKKKKAT